MVSALRTVRIIQIAFLASVVVYACLGEFLGHKLSASVTLYYVFSFISISIVGAVLVVRKTFLAASEAQLIAKIGDRVLLARWKAGHIVTYVLCQSLALLGLVLQIFGFQLSQTWTFYLSSFALMLAFGPRQPKAEFGS